MDWSSVGNQVMDILLPILATFLTGFFTYLGAKLKETYENKVNDETKKAVVNDAVRFVEQVYKDLDGPEKLKKAVKQVYNVLNSKGIKITETEINMLIESAVFGLNEGWFNEGPTDLPEIPLIDKVVLDNEILDVEPNTEIKECEGTE